MDQNTIDFVKQLLALGTGHKYLALAILVIGWLTTVASDKSKWEALNLPSRALPTVVGALGLIYGVLANVQDNHVAWGAAIQGGLVAAVVTGFLYDLVVKSWFGGPENLPRFLKWLTLLPHQSSGTSNKPPPPPRVPTNLGVILIGLGCIGALGAAAEETSGCTTAQVQSAVDGVALYACVEDGVARHEPATEVFNNCVKNGAMVFADFVRLFEKATAAQKAAYEQGKLEGEHLGCGPVPTVASPKDGGK